MKVNNNLQSLTLSIILIILLSTPPSASTSNVKAGYWFPDSGLALPSINAALFTHLFAAFADLNPSTNKISVSSSNADSFSQFTSTLRQTNPNIITLLSIGGGGGGSLASDFAAMATSPTTRKAFIESTITTARSLSFHGLDLDYEYPPTQQDMSNLATLFTEWRATIAAEAASTNRPPLLLTAAVSYSSVHDSLPYPAAAMAEALDWLNLMAYDLWGPGWSPMTRPSSALRDPATGISGSSGVATWINAGVPASKLVLGIPFYGYNWTLVDPTNNGYLAPTVTPPENAPVTVAYSVIKGMVNGNGWVTVYNDTFAESYSTSGTKWIGYDDVEAVAAKAAFVKQQALLGYFIWHIGQDDNFVLATTAFNT